MSNAGETALWVWLSLIFGTANERMWQLSDSYDNVLDFCKAAARGSVEGMTANERQAAHTVKLSEARAIIAKWAEKGVQTVGFGDELYPKRLKWIPDPPPVLYARGDITVLGSQTAIAIVGTRTPCEYSVSAMNMICSQLVEAGALVISGFEQGLDCAANKAALAAGGKTAAVCGRGILCKSPVDKLDEGIVGSGVLVSEFTDSNDYRAPTFGSRNRILCALADGVIFIECSDVSRGLDNAEKARALGRPIFALPPADITDRKFYGQRDLLRAGAVPIFGAYDVIRALKNSGKAEDMILPDIFENKKQTKTVSAKKKTKNTKKIKEKQAEDLHKSENSATIDMSGLSPRQQEICKALEKGELHMNLLAERLSLPVSVLINELMTLQIKKIIDELPGKRYRLKR